MGRLETTKQKINVPWQKIRRNWIEGIYIHVLNDNLYSTDF